MGHENCNRWESLPIRGLAARHADRKTPEARVGATPRGDSDPTRLSGRPRSPISAHRGLSALRCPHRQPGSPTSIQRGSCSVTMVRAPAIAANRCTKRIAARGLRSSCAVASHAPQNCRVCASDGLRRSCTKANSTAQPLRSGFELAAQVLRLSCSRGSSENWRNSESELVGKLLAEFGTCPQEL